MAASTFMPDVVVEIGFGYGYATALASVSWTDVSAYVEAQVPISIQRGRSDEISDVGPSTLSLTLDNRDGRFTPLYTSGAYYPNVKKGVPIRVSATWVLGGGGTTYRRITGYVDEWPVEWPTATSGSSVAAITATSRTARLARDEMADIVAQEYGADSPVMYYPLGEPQGAAQAANASRTAQPSMTAKQTGAGGTLVFGSGVGPATDALAAPVFTTAGAGNGWYLETQLQTSLLSDHVAVECWVVTADADSALVSFGTSDPFAAGSLVVDGASQPRAKWRAPAGGSFATNVIGGGSSTALRHIVLKLDKSGGSYGETLMVDGAVVDTAAAVMTTADLGTVLAAGATMRVAAYPPWESTAAFNLFSGTMAQVAVYSGAVEVTTARFTQHYLAGSTGFAGDSTDEYVARLAGYAGIPTAEQALEAGSTTSAAFEDTTGKSPLTVMLDYAHTENGLLFDAGNGTLTFHARSHRYSVASTMTLDVSLQKVEAGLTPKLDDFGMLNDVTATAPDGYTSRVVNTASVSDSGPYKAALDILTTNDYEVDDAANYRVATYATPQVRIPNCTLLLTAQTSADITALLARELGDKVTLSNLPTQAPATSMDFYIEGITETIGHDASGYWISFNLSPAFDSLAVWKLGVAGYSELGTTTRLGY